MTPLPSSFYDRDALDVAYDLIGAEVTVGPVRLRLTEVEAYRFPGDTANHARFGRTQRNAPMWGPPGHSYIYLCYGTHRMLNLVTGPEGTAAAVLVRGAEVIEGLETVLERRGGQKAPLDGPGKVGTALGLDTGQSGRPLWEEIQVFGRKETPSLLAGPRIGIDYAAEADRLAPWRIAMAGSKSVGKRKLLQPV